MTAGRCLLFAVLAASLPGTASAQLLNKLFGKVETKPSAPSAEKDDLEALNSAGLKAADPAGLLTYLKQRTLSDADLSKIQAVIAKLGDEDFETRLKAAKEVETFGPAAIAPLRAASQQRDGDAEIIYRTGDILRRMEKVSHTAVALAAARALSKAKPKDAAGVLLGYLPVADSPDVEDEIRRALANVAVPNGTPDPAVLAALTDAVAVRRGAAAVALLEGGAKSEAVKKAVLAETDPEAKFRGVMALLTSAKDPDAVAALIGLLPDMHATRGRVWQTEDYLIQLAGVNAPKTKLGGSKESLTKTRDEWVKWWGTARATTDLAKFEFKPQTTGRLFVVATNPQGWGNVKIYELGPDGRERWKTFGVNAPADAHPGPDGKIFVMEQNYSRITVRDTAGRTLDTIATDNQPMSFQLLANGNFLVSHRHAVAEVSADKAKQGLFRYTRNNNDILAAHRLANGETLVLTTGSPGNLFRVDAKGKELPDPLKVGQPFWQPRIEMVGEDRVLVTEQQRVAEYDLKTKKEVWKATVQQPTSAQRLPGGNTLVVAYNENQIREIAPDGETVWTLTPGDGMRVFRATRR